MNIGFRWRDSSALTNISLHSGIQRLKQHSIKSVNLTLPQLSRRWMLVFWEGDWRASAAQAASIRGLHRAASLIGRIHTLASFPPDQSDCRVQTRRCSRAAWQL